MTPERDTESSTTLLSGSPRWGLWGLCGAVLLAAVLVLAVAPPASSHPGRTASDGCHYCRTNCTSWGEVYNKRHCHGSSRQRRSNLRDTTVDPAPDSEAESDPGELWGWLVALGAVGAVWIYNSRDDTNT